VFFVIWLTYRRWYMQPTKIELVAWIPRRVELRGSTAASGIAHYRVEQPESTYG